MRNTRNTCAQRAAARLLSQRHGGDWHHHYDRLCASHPPDTPLRLLGTTPARLLAMLRDTGLPAELRTRAEAAHLQPGAIACVDLRPLHGRIPRLHWTLIEDLDERGVRAEGAWHTRERWMRAWSCRVSPFAMHRRALVVAEPRLTG